MDVEGRFNTNRKDSDANVGTSGSSVNVNQIHSRKSFLSGLSKGN